MPKFIKKESFKQPPDTLEQQMKRYTPRVLTYLVLVGITSAFLFLTVGYFLTTYGTAFNSFKLPVIFHANTIIILISSYAMAQTRKAIYTDDTQGYINGLLITAGIGIAFTWFQVMGWSEMGIKFNGNIAATYLYVISGLHLLHLLVGISLLVKFAFNAVEMRTDPVKMLMFEANPINKLNVSLLATYWHFVDGLWLYVYLFFVFVIYVVTPAVAH